MPDDDRDDEMVLHRGWPARDDAGANGVGANGRGMNGRGMNAAYGPQSEDEADEAPSAAGTDGRWVSRGGVLAWEEPAEGPEAGPEAESRWAADELELPAGAPSGARIRAVRAWLLAKRQAENEALGMLLLEQRRMRPADDAQWGPQGARRGIREESPLEIAMAGHQAAVDEYERLHEALGDLATHTGPERLLVEFYLVATDRLAALANAPEAPAGFAPELRTAPPVPHSPATPRAVAEWEGRARAVLLARRRVERMTAPETEE
jgi:hypothetical protein